MRSANRLERLISAILVAAVLIVVANAALAFHAEQVLADTEAWVAHTWEVIADLGEVAGLVKDAEVATRSYLITSDPQYLAAFHAAGGQLPAEIERLRELVRDNPSQLRRMSEVNSLIGMRLATMQSLLDLRARGGENAAFTLLREGIGQPERGRLGKLIGQAQDEEHSLLAARLRASARARVQARAAIAFASALDVLFIILTLWLLRYERVLRQRAAETARRLEKLQAISEVGLTQFSVPDLTREMLYRLRRVGEIDGVALCSWHGAEVQVTAVDGLALPPGTRIQLEPHHPLAICGATNAAVKLEGEEVARLDLDGWDRTLRSVLILPLSVTGKVIALVIAARSADHSFSREDEQLLSVVADRIALSIDRASLFEAEQAARASAEAAAAEVNLVNAELEQRVQQRTAELEATNQELEAFSYSVSHDLRAPLRSVDGFSVALEEDYGELLTGEGKHYLARIRAGVQRMGQLIDALLQLSRVTRSEMSIEPVELSELAREVAEELHQQNGARSVRFVIEPGLQALGDPRLLRAVLENMLGNAVKFTANVPEAEIAFGYSPAKAAYYIRDNGAGFDQQYASKLFVAFQRLHGEKDFKGSGIGLATVARVIRRHHGSMSAEGAVGQGATFWFTLGEDTQ